MFGGLVAIWVFRLLLPIGDKVTGMLLALKHGLPSFDKSSIAGTFAVQLVNLIPGIELLVPEPKKDKDGKAKEPSWFVDTAVTTTIVFTLFGLLIAFVQGHYYDGWPMLWFTGGLMLVGIAADTAKRFRHSLDETWRVGVAKSTMQLLTYVFIAVIVGGLAIGGLSTLPGREHSVLAVIVGGLASVAAGYAAIRFGRGNAPRGMLAAMIGFLIAGGLALLVAGGPADGASAVSREPRQTSQQKATSSDRAREIRCKHHPERRECKKR